MSLKSYLQSGLEDRIIGLKESVTQTEEALRILEERGTRGATYTIYIRSLWENYGEKSTTMEHKGTLKDAIERAEREFKTTNRRSDVQASIQVEIHLGNVRYPVPDRYWVIYRK